MKLGKQVGIALLSIVMAVAITGCGDEPTNTTSTSSNTSSNTTNTTTEPKEMAGVVTEREGSTFTISTENGNKYTFTMEKTATLPESVVAGSNIEVFYVGDVASNPIANEVIAKVSVSGGITGKVVEDTIEIITVQTENGNKYSFPHENADVQGEGELAVGDKVQIQYIGDIIENPEASVIVILEAVTGSVTGTIVEPTSMNIIAIQEQSGNTYVFSKEDAEVSGEGIALGATATIEYTGDLTAGPIAMNIIVISAAPEASEPVASSAPESKKPTPVIPKPTEPVLYSLAGTVTDFSNSSLTIKTAKGNHYSFQRANAKLESKGNPLTVGDKVTVTYTGVLGKKPIAKIIQVDRHVQQTIVYHTFKGTVLDGTSTTLTVEDKNTNEYRFLCSNAVVVSDRSLITGDVVEIMYTGDVEDRPKATKIVVVEHHSAVKVINGEVIALAGYTATVETNQGIAYDLDLSNAVVSASRGRLEKGAFVKVSYRGTIGTDEEVIKVAVTKAAPVPVIPQEQVIKGVVVGLGSDLVTLETSNGQDYNFAMNSKTVGYNTFGDGDTIQISYTGTLGDRNNSPVAGTITLIKHASNPALITGRF